LLLRVWLCSWRGCEKGMFAQGEILCCTNTSSWPMGIQPSSIAMNSTRLATALLGHHLQRDGKPHGHTHDEVGVSMRERGAMSSTERRGEKCVMM